MRNLIFLGGWIVVWVCIYEDILIFQTYSSRRLPSNRLRRYDNPPNQTCCYSYGRLLSLSFIIIILCCWLLILSWLVVIFNDELRRFDSNIMASKCYSFFLSLWLLLVFFYKWYFCDLFLNYFFTRIQVFLNE